ncbi:MAG: ABC transporter permease subunit [Bacillota bacterium]
MNTSSIAYRIWAVRTLTFRELKSLFLGFEVYVVATIVLLGSAAIVSSFLRSVSDVGLQVSAEPLLLPFCFAVVVFGLYLGLLATLTISRERDRGTLEVLFYGPVDTLSYVAAKFVGSIAVYAITIFVTVVAFGVLSLTTSLALTGRLARVGILSIFSVSTAISCGILLSSITSKTRNSAILFVLIMVGLGMVSLLEGYFTSLGQDVSGLGQNARVLIVWLGRGLDWLSPAAYVSRGIEAGRVGDTRMLVRGVIAPIVYTVFLLWLSVQAFKWKGVRTK